MNLIKLYHKMDAMFINSKISKTFDPNRLLLNLSTTATTTTKN